MGFSKVYKLLQEIFPQIDPRVLRAVAIEHSKDADAAVEAVLGEIIPFFTERSKQSTPLTGSISLREPSEVTREGTVAATQTVDVPTVNIEVQNVHDANGNQQCSVDADDLPNEPFYDSYNGHQEEGSSTAELTLPETFDMQTKVSADCNVESVELIPNDGENTLRFEVPGLPEVNVSISADKYLESQEEGSSTSVMKVAVDCDGEPVELIPSDGENTLRFEVSGDTEVNVSISADKSLESSANISSDSVVEDPASPSVHDLTTKPSENSVQLVVEVDGQRNDLEESDVIISNITDSKMETTRNSVGTEDESTMNASISESSQIRIVDVIEEFIADARNSKKTLFASMKSVVSLMRELEHKKQVAEQTKVEVALGGSDILVKVEELEHMLQSAKEANGKLAGDVYGEKAILATELRELQSHVLSLSVERDNSLVVLDEMRQTLEQQLAAAENEIKSAEQEKIEREKAAMKTLAEQELIMEKLRQESKMLKQQAEDNAKLQEFLVDRGRVVDILQGEIAVICEDVRLLKEKFDEHVPFSQSLSSSQTSRILASSTTSSSKSSIQEKESDALSNPDKESVARDDDRKALVDDGWEFFDA